MHLHVIACHVLWREICHLAALSKNTFNFTFLKQGLHDTPEILRREVQTAIDAVDRTPDADCHGLRLPGEPDAILLGYGLCSNGIEGIRARNKKIVVIKAHDCITFLLGSRTRYKKFFDENPGTYWYSPGWIDTNIMPGREKHRRMLEKYVAKYGEENAEYLMQVEQDWIKNYSTAAYTDLGFGDNADYRNYTRECAEYLKWHYAEVPGDASLMKKWLDGEWENNDFLTVEPGTEIVATHDEDVLAAKERQPDTTRPAK